MDSPPIPLIQRRRRRNEVCVGKKKRKNMEGNTTITPERKAIIEIKKIENQKRAPNV